MSVENCSLYIQEPQKALKTLRTLMAYHFTASDIAEVKDLVTTLRKVSQD